MKVLMINKFLYPRGGAETYMLKIGKLLQEEGHHVEYFGMYDENNTVGNSLGLYTSNVEFHNRKPSNFTYPFRIIYSLEAKQKIRKLIEYYKPDIVHMNNINFQITPAIIEVIKKRGIPLLQTVHDYQMICPNHLLFNSKNSSICEKCITKSKWNCFKDSCIHGSRIKSFLGSVEGIIYDLFKTYGKVDLYICPSYFLETKLISNRIFRGKTTVMHNYVEMNTGADECTETKEKDETKAKKYVLYFGRLSEEKGIDTLIESFKKLPDIRFIIAGGGPLEKECLGIKNVEYVGFCTGQQLVDYIKNAAFVVYPSIWYENCPLSILEAQSLGIPVITVNRGGMAELIEDNKTGLLMEEVTVEGLSNAITDLYYNSEKRERLSLGCRKKANTLLNLKGYCKRLIEIYQQLVIEQ